MRLPVIAALALMFAPAVVAGQAIPLPEAKGGMPVRLAKPRVAPLPEKEWKNEQLTLLMADWRGGPVTNDVRTLLNFPVAMRGLMPFANYIAYDSTLAPRDRELLILRTAWLCQAGYVWAQHAEVAKRIGISSEELRRIASGPEAPGWAPFEATLLRTADEIQVNSLPSDQTWNALAARYDMLHLMDAVMTVGQTTLNSVLMNSLGVQIDNGLTERLPTDIPNHTKVVKNDDRLIGKKARIPFLKPSEWTPEVRLMLDPTSSGRPVGATYTTLAQHPKLYRQRWFLSDHIRSHSEISARIKESAIGRISALCLGEYEWGGHMRSARTNGGLTDADVYRVFFGPDGKEAPEDGAVLHAVDEMYYDKFVSDATWNKLAATLSTKQILDVLIATTGYYMNAMKLNSFGVQIDSADREPFPKR